jgi:hypothetical protein
LSSRIFSVVTNPINKFKTNEMENAIISRVFLPRLGTTNTAQS